MVALRLPLLIAFLCIAHDAIASDELEMGLLPERAVQNPRIQGASRFSEEVGEEARLQLRLMGGFALRSSGLSGTGFNVSLPYTQGTLFGGEVRYRPSLSSDLSIRAKLRSAATQYRDLPSLSPSSIRESETLGSLAFFGRLFESSGGVLEKMSFGIGYWYGQRSADETTPNLALTRTQRHGISLGAEFATAWGRDFSVEANLELQLAHAFSESPVNTGFYSSSTAGEIGVALIYEITSVLSVSGGLRLRSDSVSFSGTGNRGTTDGRDHAMGFLAPFEVRFSF